MNNHAYVWVGAIDMLIFIILHIFKLPHLMRLGYSVTPEAY